MASPALPPRKKSSRQPAPTTILALGDDLLREVFLRLPSLPTLVRAALACPAFLRAVRSSPAFRRRFRDLHSPTILGAFLVDDEPTTPTFAPVRLRGRRSDPDHAAALRGLDVFLTRLPDAIGVKKDDAEDAEDDDEDVQDEEDDDDEEDDADEDEDDEEDAIGVKKDDAEDEDEDVQDEEDDDDEEDDKDDEPPMPTFAPMRLQEVAEDEDEDEGWSMLGCRDGYVLLVTPRWNTKKVAVYDPLTGALHLFPGPPHEVFSADPEYTEAEFHVIPSEADDRSFRVLCVPKEDGGKQIAVLSPDTREWQISPTPWSLQDADNVKLVRNGLVYWACYSDQHDYIPVLNTATMQFSQTGMPPTGPSGVLGETKDGKLCLARAHDGNLELMVWFLRAGRDGVDKWRKNRTFQMVDAMGKLALNIVDECPSLNVVAIVGGIVYLTIHQNEPPNWLLSFCIETRELQKLCRITTSEFCYPYIMAWPPSLVPRKTTAALCS